MSASDSPSTVSIAVDDATHVSGLLELPAGARACFVLAHGAGAGMRHAFLAAIAADFATLGVATLRYQFPYMERGSRRTDPPKLCHATVRAAVLEAGRLAPGVPLFAGGKSFGGRMTSQAQAFTPLPDVRGLIFLGFPLHPPKKPSDERAEHLARVQVPMLFTQGTQDEFAELGLLTPVVKKLGDRATLQLFEHADHSFHVPARSGKKDAEVRGELVKTVVGWISANR